MAIALLTACSNDDSEKSHNERVPLEILASIDLQADPMTRAAESSWEANDKIGVFMTTYNTSTIFEDSEHKKGYNLPYTFDDGTNYETWGNTYRLFTPNSGKIYLSSAATDVYGYYPYKEEDAEGAWEKIEDENHVEKIWVASTAANAQITKLNIDLTDQRQQNKIDLMRAYTGNVSNMNASIELLFYHRLVKLVFNLKQGDDMLPNELKDATSLTMTLKNQPRKATYDIYNDKVTIPDGNTEPFGPIIPVRASSAPTGYVRTFEAIVMPNGANNPADKRTVEIEFYKKNNDVITNTFVIPSSTYFHPGYKYTFNVTVNATSIEVNTVNEYTEQW